LLGITTEQIPADGFGFVTQFGFINKVDTSTPGWSLGDLLYVDPANAGLLTNVKPSAPNWTFPVAAVTRVHASTGRILVRALPGKHLHDLVDVAIDSPADNEVLAYNSASGVWINQTPSEAGLIDTSATAQTKAGDLTITGTGSFNNATVTSGAASSSTTTGALKVDGGVGVTGNIYAGGNLVITGDLTVSGDTTTLNTATLNVEDNIITLNSGVTGSPTLNAGVEVNRGTSTDVSLNWNESLDKWTATYDLNGNKEFAINEVSTLQVVNDNGSTLNPLDPVFVSGVNVIDGTAYVEKMSNNTEKFFGFTTSSVLDETKCVVVTRGLVTGVDTSSYLNGDILYVSSSGTLTTTKPSGIYVQKVAKVLHSNASGSIYVYSHESILPDLSNGYVWAGNSTSTPTETLLNTANVPELTNLYFTDERAQDAVGNSVGSGLSYNDSTGAISNSGVLSIIGTTNEIDILGTNAEIQIGIPNSPVFVTPNIGVATATSVNGTTIPSSKTLVVTTDIGTSVQAYDADLNAIASLTGTSGILTTNGSGTWSVDTNTYSTISHNHSLDGLSNVVITGTPTDGQAIVWDTTTSKWVNETVSGGSASYPTQSGNNGKFLQTDGTNVSWAFVDLSSYLTSESDTLETVTDRGASSTNAITISNTTQSTTPTSGALIISGGVGIAKDVWIDGDLHVNGTTVTENTKTVATNDNMIYLNAAQDTTITNAVGDGTYVTYTAENNYTPGMDIRVTGMNPSGYNISSADGLTVYSATSTQFVVAKTTTGSFVSGGIGHAKEEVNPDLGFAGGYYSGGYAHAGLFRDASDGVFKIFDGYTPEPDEAVNIDTTHASFSFAPIKVESLDVTDSSTTRSNLGLVIGTDVQARTPTLDNISAGYYDGSLSIYMLGTVTSGTWNGTTIGYAYGGTGLTTLGTAGQVLTVNSGATALEWSTPSGGGGGLTTTSTAIGVNTPVVIESFAVSASRTAEAIIQITQGTDYYSSKVLLIHDGTNVKITEYAILESTVGAIPLTISADISGSNVELLAEITDAGTTNATAKVVLIKVAV
jgi:hypothetical protein